MADQTETLKVGDTAPDFELVNQDREKFKLSEARGKNVVLNFFPAAFSGVCTNQMGSIQESKALFDDDTLVFGVSVDGPFALKAFQQQTGIDFPLLSDFYPHGAVAQAYGLLFPNGAAHRAVIGIDKDGIIRYIDDHAVLEVPELDACAVALKK
jgi:peroxiredoxin (alkyl hydroperoxide reductase subunit C)